jgi:hypothetical protein
MVSDTKTLTLTYPSTVSRGINDARPIKKQPTPVINDARLCTPVINDARLCTYRPRNSRAMKSASVSTGKCQRLECMNGTARLRCLLRIPYALTFSSCSSSACQVRCSHNHGCGVPCRDDDELWKRRSLEPFMERHLQGCFSVPVSWGNPPLAGQLALPALSCFAGFKLLDCVLLSGRSCNSQGQMLAA